MFNFRCNKCSTNVGLHQQYQKCIPNRGLVKTMPGITETSLKPPGELLTLKVMGHGGEKLW